MKEFLTAALPWIALGVTIAVVIAYSTKKTFSSMHEAERNGR